MPAVITVTDDKQKESEVAQDYSNSKFSVVEASILPQEGNIEDFDFDLNLTTEDLGAETKKLRVEGRG